MLCTLMLSPRIVACGSTATSGCQSRSFDGWTVLHHAANATTPTQKQTTANQRVRRENKARLAARPAATVASALASRTRSSPGPAKYTAPATQQLAAASATAATVN